MQGAQFLTSAFKVAFVVKSFNGYIFICALTTRLLISNLSELFYEANNKSRNSSRKCISGSFTCLLCFEDDTNDMINKSTALQFCSSLFKDCFPCEVFSSATISSFAF